MSSHLLYYSRICKAIVVSTSTSTEWYIWLVTCWSTLCGTQLKMVSWWGLLSAVLQCIIICSTYYTLLKLSSKHVYNSTGHWLSIIDQWFYPLSLNRSARKRIYACKWTNMVYQLQMAMFCSILGPRINLIGRKCSKFNGEMDNVFDLGSKTYFWWLSIRFKILVRIHAYMSVNREIWSSNYIWLCFGQY
jgi:hypothetical protein